MDHTKDRDDGSAPLAPLLRLAWQLARRQIYEGLRQAGYDDLTPADLAVFQYPTPEGARPTDLASGALMTKQAVNRIIRHLEERGYLRLEREATDQRARVVRLTERGRRLLASIRELHAEVETEWARRMGRRQLAALRRAVIDLTDGVVADPSRRTIGGAAVRGRSRRRGVTAEPIASDGSGGAPPEPPADAAHG